MKLSFSADSPGADFHFARYILLMGLFLMPLLAYFDYTNGYIQPSIAKISTFFLCLAGYILSRDSRNAKYVCLGAAGAILLMSLIGAAYKLDSYYSIIWVAVLPAMFSFLSGLRLGIILSALYLVGYVFFYFSFAELQGKQPVEFEAWMHSILVYLAVLSISVMFKSEKQKNESYLKQVAERDYLTNVLNRRGFVPNMLHELKRANRYKYHVSVILFDVDFFKKVNDVHGHAEGDKLLVSLMDLILPQIRDSDSIGRWGGEEFIILTPQAGIDAAGELAEKLREIIAENEFEVAGKITASFGVAEYHFNESWDSFIDRADANLYRAKHGGRNTVVSGS